MSSSRVRRYRLEIAVKQLHDLVDMSAAARVVFSVRFSTFPEVFIRPQAGGGGGVAEPSPAGDRILSLSYNVRHKAEFHLDDGEARRLFPAECICRVCDSTRPDAVATWSCPCPLIADTAVAEGWQQSSYAMRNAAGHAMGFAQMSCRVVSLEDEGAAMKNATPATRETTTVMNGGKPYVIRVILDSNGQSKGQKSKSKSKRKNLPKVERSDSMAAQTTALLLRQSSPSRQTDAGCVVSDGEGNKKENMALEHGGGHGFHSRSAKKKSFLYVLQYDVAYQVQSNCGTLYATLKREFHPLNSVSLGTKAKPMLTKVDHIVQSILRLANIALQLVNQLAEGEGEPYTEISADPKGRRNPVNKLALPRDGTVAHFLMYQVLFQLQCLGTNLCHVTFAYRHTLEVPLSTLPSQHVKFITRLSEEVQELTKYVNIIVQSTIDGSLGTKNGDDVEVMASATYSSFNSSKTRSRRSTSSSSSSSSSSTSSRSASGETVHSVPITATPAFAYQPRVLTGPTSGATTMTTTTTTAGTGAMTTVTPAAPAATTVTAASAPFTTATSPVAVPKFTSTDSSGSCNVSPSTPHYTSAPIPSMNYKPFSTGYTSSPTLRTPTVIPNPKATPMMARTVSETGAGGPTAPTASTPSLPVSTGVPTLALPTPTAVSTPSPPSLAVPPGPVAAVPASLPPSPSHVVPTPSLPIHPSPVASGSMNLPSVPLPVPITPSMNSTPSPVTNASPVVSTFTAPPPVPIPVPVPLTTKPT